MKHRPGGAYLLRGERMTEAERTLLASVARAVLSGDRGELANQLDRPHPTPEVYEPEAHVLLTPADVGASATNLPAAEVPTLVLANGRGGFAEGGRDYVIVLDGDEETPLPWANVIANPRLGTVVTASGAAYSWSENSRENRLTPHANDPVTDLTSEALYVRDDDTGQAWSPTPGPMRRTPESGRCVVRHGAGVTRFTRSVHGIGHELEVFVDAQDPVKFSLLTLTNGSGRPRRLSVFAYNEWVLGPPRPGQHLHVATEHDAATGAVLARTTYNHDFAGAWPSRTRASRCARPRATARRSWPQPVARGPARSGRDGSRAPRRRGPRPCAVLHVS